MKISPSLPLQRENATHFIPTFFHLSFVPKQGIINSSGKMGFYLCETHHRHPKTKISSLSFSVSLSYSFSLLFSLSLVMCCQFAFSYVHTYLARDLLLTREDSIVPCALNLPITVFYSLHRVQHSDINTMKLFERIVLQNREFSG